MRDIRAESSAAPLTDSWKKSLSALKAELDPQVYAAYIKPLELHSFDEATGEFSVSAPSKLVCNHVDRNFKTRLCSALANELGVKTASLKIDVRADRIEGGESVTESRQVIVRKVKPRLKLRPDGAALPQVTGGFFQPNPKYTFSSFVVGNSNQFCHAAALRVAEQPGQSYNPLFIYGGVGLGKTHLLHAIGNAVLGRNPKARVLYMSSETFTNELIQALRNAKMDEFKNRMRSIEVLLIDDIQFMCGKERTQEEFFHTFNALYSAKHQIVITSDKIPQDIPGIEERLQTRFSWGLTADLQAPDFETRVAILNRKANLESFSVPENVSHFIAENISSNVRELEGALTRVHAMSSLQDKPITLELTQTALKPLFQPKTVALSVDDIKRAVAEHFGIKVSEMVSKRRTKNLSFPRHIAMYLCRKHTTYSYPEIGGHFGGRDHSSVIHAANVVSTKIGSDPQVKALVSEIERRLLSH